MKKHQRLAEAEMKKKALALELKRERELRRAKEDMYEDKRVIDFKIIYLRDKKDMYEDKRAVEC